MKATSDLFNYQNHDLNLNFLVLRKNRPVLKPNVWIGQEEASKVPTFPDWQNSLTFPVFFPFPVFLPPANEVCEGYVFTPFCQSFYSRGGLSIACWDTAPHPPPRTRGRHRPSRHPREQTPPWSSACLEIQATSGQYTSYWNAILFNV